MKQMIYFDYAAATPVDKSVLADMLPFFSTNFFNPSANYLPAQKVRHEIARSRAQVAHWLGAKPGEIVFTAGGTEANNLAIRGVMETFPGSHLVVSAIEHESVLEPTSLYPHTSVEVSPVAIVDLEAMYKAINDKTVLVSLMYANNEVGSIQPLREVSELITKIRRARLVEGNPLPIYLHTDAAQATNYLDLHVSRLGVDLMTINGGKIYGPKQSGALFIRANTKIQPQILGGGQERGLRSGTENVAGIIGLASALEQAQQQRRSESERLQKLQQLFMAQLNQKIPTATINGPSNRLPNNIHFSIPGQDNERLLVMLENEGIYAAAGSACSAAQGKPSHVLFAMGIKDEIARASLRFSMGRDSDENGVRAAVDVLAKLVA